MKTFKTHYFNAFTDKDGDFFIESKELTYEAAIIDIMDANYAYSYTLKISLEQVERIDLEEEALDIKFNDSPESERLTGHEYGTNPGRV